MALKITDRDMKGVTVVELEGHVLFGEAANGLREKVKGLLAENKKKVVLNMARVTMIDSAGLGTLAGLQSSAASQGARLCLCNLGAKPKELLQMTRLLTVFDVSESEMEAVRSFTE
jgi:anti-sigma B factor antagonist